MSMKNQIELYKYYFIFFYKSSQTNWEKINALFQTLLKEFMMLKLYNFYKFMVSII